MASTRTKKSPVRLRMRPMKVLKNVPSKGFDWGWFSREDPRMHLQPVSKKHMNLGYKIWLESGGKRDFVPNEELSGISSKELRAIIAEVERQRRAIELEWTCFMMDQDWISLRLTGSIITVTAYPRFPTRFTRTVELARILAGIYDPSSQLVPEQRIPPGPDDIGLNPGMAAIEIFTKRPESRRHHLYLPDILWQD